LAQPNALRHIVKNKAPETNVIQGGVMPGKIRQMIDTIIGQSAAGNPMLQRVIKTKMILKGINPAKFTDDSVDDPAIIAKLENMMQSFGASCSKTEEAIAQKPSRGKIQTAFSSLPKTADCVKDLRNQLSALDPVMVLFFASTRHAPETISRYMKEAFPKAQVFGCSTAGEITSGRMLSDSVVAMGFDKAMVWDLKIEIVRPVDQRSAIEQACKNFEMHFGQSVTTMDPARFVGISLIDGLAGGEEIFMETLGDLTSVPFIGGSAGDDQKFSRTYIYANGNTYTDAALIALLKPGAAFSFIKTQSFRPLGKTLKVTRADEAERQVLQFNGKAAPQAYAEAIGAPVNTISKHFMRNPVGLIIEGEPFVRSPQRISGDSMFFYCSVKEGMKLSLLESTDILLDTRQAIERTKEKLGNISGIINFDCILRTLDLQQRNLSAEYGKLFSDFPTAGFSTYGEQYIGHINQTATMLVFG
jgi:hypothetical protein